MQFQELFYHIYRAKDEDDLHKFITENLSIFSDDNWKPLGGNKSNYGVVKNQQSNPIAALIEKATNSIDAILTKHCYLKGIDPKSDLAPQKMDEAIETFFPQNSWDLSKFRNAQAEEIQIIADGHGPRNQKKQFPTSVIIYDNGEGQHPERFENTFLSLLQGNKNDIQFVQGKYNMGGSGAIVFCGRKRYQLIASKRYDNKGEFGFTLIREHPKKESDNAKETWYEYLLIDGKIPSFPIDKLDLGLQNRSFETGTIIKMYSYQFPKGYSGFAQDLNQSINEFLFSPALPILTKDIEERYPNNKVLVNDLYGLKRRLSGEAGYVNESFSEMYEDELFGKMKVSCFVFNSRIKEHDIKKSKEIIQSRYFKNGMNVIFSMNGQVHGFYTSEFITRSLKLNLLKNHLLIHVDCTEMKYEFRKELFMASRDRLKDGEETQQLRQYLAKKLGSADGRLHKIQKIRKQAVNIDTSTNTNQLIKSFTKNLPINSDLMKLLGDTFKLDLKKEQTKKDNDKKKSKTQKEETPFHPKRFPSIFTVDSKAQEGQSVATIPLNGEKTIKFSSDVENEYFDRTEEPGDLTIALLGINNNETDGGKAPGIPKEITDVFNISKSSPNKGKIKINLNPKEDVKVGDVVQMKVSLSSPNGGLEQTIMVKISDPEKPKEKKPELVDDNEPLGLPQLIFAYKDSSDKGENAVSWEDVGTATNSDMNVETVMIPEAEGENLISIFVNMESKVLMNFKSKDRNPNEEQIELSNRKYYTSVYFHTLFLYTITKNRGYQINQKAEGTERFEEVELGAYLKDLFDNYYSIFILNFGGMEEMMQGIAD